MKKQQTNSSYAAIVKGATESNISNQKKLSVATTVNHMNKNIEDWLNYLESRFDKLEAAFNWIVNHLEKKRFPTFIELVIPNIHRIEIILNELPACQKYNN